MLALDMDLIHFAGQRLLRYAAFTTAVLLAVFAFMPSSGAAVPVSEDEFFGARVRTDGHFRPGSKETIIVRNFPRAGRVEVSFFPTAICGSKCSGVSRFGGRADAAGAGTLHVRVPGYFFDAHGHRTYFLDRERLDLEVTWEGREDEEFAVGSPKHKPVIRRAGGCHKWC